jgi:pSer/pThr/pTyr-binding forkhead associated (FHA) protein
MIVCSNCKHANISGAIFCGECGAQLTKVDGYTTQNFAKEKAKDASVKKTNSSAVASVQVAAKDWVTLHLLDTGQVLSLAERNEFTLGRISEGQPIMPDIDFSPYQAYASGVSRLHAVIKRDASRILLMDLGSANGTYVNGKRLLPNAEHILVNGDVIALGKLKMQVLLKSA